MQLISIPGTTSYVDVSLSNILRRAVCSKCSGVILAHNHPSRVKRPSTTDLTLTRRLCLAAEAMDITLLDHLIFNHGAPFSFRNSGFI